MRCGDANPNGNVYMRFKGGCDRDVELKDAYRCTGCGGWFHKECILKHFEEEKSHDWGRQQERERIADLGKNLTQFVMSWKEIEGVYIPADAVRKFFKELREGKI